MHSSTTSADRPLPATVRGLGWTSFLTDLSSEAIYPLLPAFVMRELGGSALSVGLLDGIANFVAAIVRLPAGIVSDRVGRRPLILLGYGLSAVIRPLMGLVTTPVGAVVRDPARAAPDGAAAVRIGRLDRRQWPLLGSVAVWSLGASSEQFLLMRAADLGLAQAFIPILWLAASLVKSGTATRAGRLVDAAHPRAALAAGWLVFALGYVGLALSPGLPAAIALILVIAAAYGLAEPAERALVAALAPAGRQGGAFGWYALVQGMMALPAGLLAGWLWQQGPAGPAWAFAVTATLSVLSIGVLLVTTKATLRGGE